MDFRAYMEEKRALVNEALNQYLPSPKKRSRRLHQAMRYSCFAGGKRLRPILAINSFELTGGKGEGILPSACGLELIHTYSLIHDDLPSMDDDDLRRGKLTLHRAFDEGLALLAGDALHALAFELLASSGNPRLVQEVAQAIGSQGIIGGQVADLEAEGVKVGRREVEYIHLHKTAALFRVSLRLGAILSGGSAEELACLSKYGERLGLLFQIVDDILDVEGEKEKLGKPVGSDQRRGKATYPSVWGMAEAKREAERLAGLAQRDVRRLGPKAGFLHWLPEFILTRRG